MDTLLKAGARPKLSKCSFGFRRAEVPGNVVDKDGLGPSSKHLKSINKLIGPASGDEMMRFLWLANLFAAFVDSFADKASLLYDFLKGTVMTTKWPWRTAGYPRLGQILRSISSESRNCLARQGSLF